GGSVREAVIWSAEAAACWMTCGRTTLEIAGLLRARCGLVLQGAVSQRRNDASQLLRLGCAVQDLGGGELGACLEWRNQLQAPPGLAGLVPVAHLLVLGVLEHQANGLGEQVREN